MPFGVNELFSIFAGAGFLANKSRKERQEKRASLTRNDLIDQYIKKYTDPELEKKLIHDILDPQKYDEIWDRIESYKKRRGGWYVWKRHNPAWQEVGTHRLPFRTMSGQTYTKNQYENNVLQGNRNKALYMLMHTYGKMTVNDATWEARNASTAMLSNWLVKHPAQK